MFLLVLCIRVLIQCKVARWKTLCDWCLCTSDSPTVKSVCLKPSRISIICKIQMLLIHFVLLKCTNVAVGACLFLEDLIYIYMRSCSCHINMWLIFAIITNYIGFLRHHEWHVYHIKSCSVNCNHHYEICAHAVHICMITFFHMAQKRSL